jgi:hypothetical protein
VRSFLPQFPFTLILFPGERKLLSTFLPIPVGKGTARCILFSLNFLSHSFSSLERGNCSVLFSLSLWGRELPGAFFSPSISSHTHSLPWREETAQYFSPSPCGRGNCPVHSFLPQFPLTLIFCLGRRNCPLFFSLSPWERAGVRAPDRTVKIRNPISFQPNSLPDPLHSSLSFCEKYHSLPCICTINGRCLAEFV